MGVATDSRLRMGRLSSPPKRRVLSPPANNQVQQPQGERTIPRRISRRTLASFEEVPSIVRLRMYRLVLNLQGHRNLLDAHTTARLAQLPHLALAVAARAASVVHAASRVRVLVASLKQKKLGGEDDERTTWPDTDKTSGTKHWQSCYHPKAPHWTKWQPRSV